jgi:hypothetical protein
VFDFSGAQAPHWMALAALSVVLFVGSIFVLHRIIVRLPAGYFSSRDRAARQGRASLPVRLCRNVGGVVLVIAGIIMLVTPGQGILTILIGVTLVDFPGKHRVEHWLIARPAVLSTINTWRGRAGQPDLFLDE